MTDLTDAGKHVNKPHIGEIIGNLKYIRMQLRGMETGNASANLLLDKAAEYIDVALEEVEHQ